MPTLSEDILREAISYADGWYWGSNDLVDPPPELSPIGPVSDSLPRVYIAALASQLISQVDGSGKYGTVHVIEYDSRTQILEGSVMLDEKLGPNRDENSILLCTEFLREKGNG